MNRSKSSITDEEITKNLVSLLETTNYSMVQENGQRKYGGPCPGWGNLEAPPKSCELFISQIPKSCFEDVLVPLFAAVGKIYEMRLMLNFEGGHRGYAYVKYTNEEDANEAIKRLDDFKLPMSHKPLRVAHSYNHSELQLTNVPIALLKQFENFVHQRTEGLKSMEITDGNTKVFLEYDTHRSAAIARRFLLSNLNEIFGRDDVRIQLIKRNTKQDDEKQVSTYKSGHSKQNDVNKPHSSFMKKSQTTNKPFMNKNKPQVNKNAWRSEKYKLTNPSDQYNQFAASPMHYYPPTMMSSPMSSSSESYGPYMNYPSPIYAPLTVNTGCEGSTYVNTNVSGYWGPPFMNTLTTTDMLAPVDQRVYQQSTVYPAYPSYSLSCP